MKVYESIHLVKPEDLNHHGTLFAARGASWLIEAGFTTAACEHGDTDEIVLRTLNNMSYFKPVQKGTIIKIMSRVVYTGKTSLMVAATAKDVMNDEIALESFLTFVTIDKNTGKKTPHTMVLDETSDEEELRLRNKAMQMRN